MANVTPTSPFKKQKLKDLGNNANAERANYTDNNANAERANYTDQTTMSSTTPQASAPTSSSRPSMYLNKCFEHWKASDDEKESILHSVKSFGTLVRLLDDKYKTINKLQATVDELQATNKKLQATIQNQEKELEKLKTSSEKGLIKKAVEKMSADMLKIEQVAEDTRTILRALRP